MENTQQLNLGENTQGKISSFVILSLLFLLPIISFIPFKGIDIPFKGYLVIFASFVALLFWSFARLSDGVIMYPKNPLYKFLGFFLVSSFISLLLSPVFANSFLGNYVEMTTFVSTVALAIIFFIISTFDLKNISKLLKVVWLSSFLGVIGSFVGYYLNFKGFTFFYSIANQSLFGSWTDTALLSGALLITGMTVLISSTDALKRKTKFILYINTIVALLSLVVINSTIIWYIVGVFSLVSFVYVLSMNTKNVISSDDQNKRKLPTLPFFVVLICLLFILGGDVVGSFISKVSRFSYFEAFPSTAKTITITISEFAQKPIHIPFGVGPNNFGQLWSLRSNIDIGALGNGTFNFGGSYVTTILSTFGLVGFVLFLLFLINLIIAGFQVLRHRLKEQKPDLWIITTILLVLYFAATLTLVPSQIVVTTIILSIFASCVAVVTSSGYYQTKRFVYIFDPRKSFITMLAIVGISILSVCSMYIATERIVAVNFYAKAFRSANENSAFSYLSKATQFNSHFDDAYRLGAQIGLVSFRTNASQANSEAEKQNAQNSYSNALQNAITATTLNSKNYLNWYVLGTIYETGLEYGNKEAYDQAMASLAKGLSLAPKSAVLSYIQSKTYFIHGDYQNALQYVDNALYSNQNQPEYWLLKSQVLQKLGKTDESKAILQELKKAFPGDNGIDYLLNQSAEPAFSNPSQTTDSVKKKK